MEKWLTGGGFERHPPGVEKWFTDLPKARIAMEAGTHSIWGQRTASGDGPRGDRGEREGTAGDCRLLPRPAAETQPIRGPSQLRFTGSMSSFAWLRQRC